MSVPMYMLPVFWSMGLKIEVRIHDGTLFARSSPAANSISEQSLSVEQRAVLGMAKSKSVCHPFHLDKAPYKSFGGAFEAVDECGQVVHTDLKGPLLRSIQSSKYSLLFGSEIQVIEYCKSL